MFNNLRIFCFVISITFVFLLAQSSLANITDGTFDDNLNISDYWTIEGTVQPWPGVARLAPSEEDPFAPNSRLSQYLTLEENSKTLSFYVAMDTAGSNETDEFTASLGGIQFYYWDSAGNEVSGDKVFVTELADDDYTVFPDFITGKRRFITLDISGLTGNPELVFNLSNDYTDGLDPDNNIIDSPTYIYIDNVNVSGNVAVVPVPGAMLLGCIGAAIVGVFRRVKSIC